MENNKKNQKQTFNYNKVDNQYKKNLEKLKERIKDIEKDRNMSKNEKKDKLSQVFFNFILQNNLPENKELADIINIISETIKNNPGSANNIVNGFTRGYISAKKDLAEIGNTISKIIQDNPDFAFNIIDGFTQCYIVREKDLTKIGNTISKIVHGNPNYAFYIAYAFTHACILQRNDLKDEDIIGAISKIVKNNQNSAFNIIDGFTQSYISAKNDLKDEDISDTISKIIKCNPGSAFDIADVFTQDCISAEKDLTEIGNIISTIIKTDGIENNQDLVFNVINGFVQACLMEKPDNIKDITESFSKSLNGMKDKTKDTLKPIFSLIVSQYFINTLTDSSNKRLTGGNKTETEEQLFNCYKELFHVENEQGFQDIPLKELSDLQDTYLKERFKEEGVNGGTECETFLKMACNLIPKSEDNEKPNVENLEDKNKPTVADLEKQKDIFKDLKFIRLDNNYGIKSKKELFGKIGLTEKNFGDNRKDEDSDFSIVNCVYLNHGFVMIIDKTQEWEKAIDENIESICLIDSSQAIKKVKNNFSYLLENKQEIFNSAPTLNDHHYQENDTCWLNAMSAIGFLLEKQQVTKPYGLSIDELLKGFGKKRDDKSGKITESATTKKELPLFEQGICDYSTEHFYPLINHSEEEKYFITKVLAEKVNENSNSQKELTEMSERLEKSRKIQETELREKQDAELEEKRSETLREYQQIMADKKKYREPDTKFRLIRWKASMEKQRMMFELEIRKKQNEERIIYENYLKKSLEQIAKDENRLKKFCTKLSILDLNQGENSNNKNHFIDIVKAKRNNGSITIYNSK